MRLVASWWLSWWMAAIVLLFFTTMVEPVASQQLDNNNTMIRWYCSFYNVMNGEFFLRNLNTTFSSLRKQLSLPNVHYAIGKTLINGESVYGLAMCRDFLSTASCLSCFDTALAYLKVCGVANGAHVFYDDCELRYENGNFYAEAIVQTSVGICGNTSTTQPKELRRTARALLSDLRIATPRTSNFFAASTRREAHTNTTVYALAQCGRNLSQSVCAECLKVRYDTLDGCLPHTFGKAIDSGCFMRYSETPFFRENQTTDITAFLKEDSSHARSIIGGVFGGVGFLLLVLAFLLWYRLSRKPKGGQHGKPAGATEMLQRPITCSYNDLKMATNHFSEEHKLGGEGFGGVYKGILKDGSTVAVKKTVMNRKGKASFDCELKIISNVHHRHLIRLLGYCSKGPHLFLVLEYMENGSLDKLLYGDKRGSLNWKQRFDIIFGTARGLAYLHEQYHVTIIHSDIKSSNILLDNEFQPKISDFGLIRLLPDDKTHLSTKFAGSMHSSYVAPEYAIDGQLSEKVDTYSFGLLVLEIISGKRCTDILETESGTQNLLDQARNLYQNDMHLNLIDDTLVASEFSEEDAKKIIEIALMCTQSSASERPAMSEVVTLLSDKTLDERPPVRSTFNDLEVSIRVDTTSLGSTF